MIDLLYAGLTIAFFLAMLAYARGCEALGEPASRASHHR